MDRSEIMRRVHSVDTRPEMAVRKIVWSLGYRYRLHKKDLPGKPDLVFIGKRKIIFVHGCFWHGHSCKRGARIPKSNRAYWVAKIGRNVARDREHLHELKKSGWSVLTIWECEIRNLDSLREKISRFLDTCRCSAGSCD